jgi:hypothetical protein
MPAGSGTFSRGKNGFRLSAFGRQLFIREKEPNPDISRYLFPQV